MISGNTNKAVYTNFIIMKTSKIYYHVIEDGGNYNIASHGYFITVEDAQKECDRRNDFFPNLNHYIYQSTSKKEPEIVTV